jgi:endonuclease/exonuclease/phosphatase (EEP) superfamily protein YafD
LAPERAPIVRRQALAALRGVATAAVLLSALPVLLMSLAHLPVWPAWWWLELLHYLPFPVLLGPALIALFASLLLGRWARGLALLSVLLALSVVMGLALGRADAGSGRLRVMTYNAKAYLAEERPGGFERLVAEVQRHDPDLLVMQDAGELTEQRDKAPASVAPLFDRHSVYTVGQYIIVSRLPLRDCHTQDITHGVHDQKLARCTVTAHGIDIDVVTTHLLSPREGLNATRRERLQGLDEWRQNFVDRFGQAQKLAGHIAPRTRPMILAGDLNAPEAAAVMRTLLRTGLRDAFSSAALGYGYTHGHSLRLGFSFLRIDHVLVSPEVGVVDSFTGGGQASEHRPVIADLLLRRESH